MPVRVSHMVCFSLPSGSNFNLRANLYLQCLMNSLSITAYGSRTSSRWIFPVLMNPRTVSCTWISDAFRPEHLPSVKFFTVCHGRHLVITLECRTTLTVFTYSVRPSALDLFIVTGVWYHLFPVTPAPAGSVCSLSLQQNIVQFLKYVDIVALIVGACAG